MKQVEIKNLYKSFKLSKKQRSNKKTNLDVIIAVNDVSFTFHEGEIYGLLGPNGAGKTTALRMISSIIRPEKGQILFEGKDIYEDINAYRRKIGFLTSELKLDNFFTPDYTFTYMARLYGLNEEEIAARKEELFKRFGIGTFKDVKIHDLSTGMKQKVSLAISICHNPDIIIFDEPTNGLDIISSKDVENFLLELKKEGKIILISTHIFSLVEKLCDRVGIIIEGKLILDDELKHLTSERSLEEVFFDLYERSKN